MQPRYPLLFWDLDGTLTDPKEGITKSVQYALLRLGIPAPDLDLLTPFIGPPLLTSFQELYGLDRATAEQAVRYYRERFETDGIFENKVFPEIPRLLADLQQSGVRMAVATSKPLPLALRILDHFDLRRHFAGVYGADMSGRTSTKRDVLALALHDLADAERAVAAMIGDHPVDVEAAKYHGLAAIAVLYGYGDPARLLEASPQGIAAHVADLRSLLFLS